MVKHYGPLKHMTSMVMKAIGNTSTCTSNQQFSPFKELVHTINIRNNCYVSSPPKNHLFHSASHHKMTTKVENHIFSMASAWRRAGERKTCDFMNFQHHATILMTIAAQSWYAIQITTAWKITGVRKACNFMDFQHHTSILAIIAAYSWYPLQIINIHATFGSQLKNITFKLRKYLRFHQLLYLQHFSVTQR